MSYFVRARAYFRSRIEPALFPTAKREPSQMQADTAPKSGCLDHDEPIGNVGSVFYQDKSTLTYRQLVSGESVEGKNLSGWQRVTVERIPYLVAASRSVTVVSVERLSQSDTLTHCPAN